VGKLPLESIRQILKKECDSYQVSLEAVVGLRDFLEQVTIGLAREASEEMVKYNRNRERNGLRKKKRLPGWITKRITNNVLKKISYKKMGFWPRETENPGGTMSTKTEATKPDNKTTDDQREVV